MTMVMRRIVDIVLVSIISFFVIIYDLIALPVYMIIYFPLCKVPKSNISKVSEVEIGNSKSKTYVCRVTNVKKEDSHTGLETIRSLVNFSVNRHRFKKCLGTREILNERQSYRQDRTNIAKYIIGPYKWKTFNVMKDEVLLLGRGLRSLGIEPRATLAILSTTRAEWIISALACFEKDITLVVLDLSMDLECIIQLLKDIEPLAMITSEDQLPKALSCTDSLPTMKIIIYIEQYKKESILYDFPKTISLYSYTSVCERGKNLIIEGSQQDPDAVAVIIFTKSTTGPPKGVILTQRNVVSSVKLYNSYLHFTTNDVMIGYLPLSNIMEFFLGEMIFKFMPELTVIVAGGSIGYSSNFINSDNSMKVIFGIHGDTTVLQPTVMFAHPHLIQQFNKSIAERIQKLRIFSRNLTQFGITYKKFWLLKGFKTPLTNRIIFSRMAKMLGSKMRMIICGGSYLPAPAQLYATVTLCSAVIQSYGLTENAAAGMCQNFADYKMGQVGKPLEGVYVRLEEMFGNNCLTSKPTAELILGGDCVSQGYTNFPDKAVEDFFIDGDIRWVRTGDVVIMHKNGSFEIIDRKADIIKLEHGKCVPLGKLEAVYKMSKWVNNIYLYGDEGSKFLVAILIPDKEHMSRLANSFGLKFLLHSQLYSELKITTAVADLFIKYAKSYNLSAHEIPAAVTLVDHEWTHESGFLTPTNQLKRKSVYSTYEAQIAYMYEELSKKQNDNKNKSNKKREILVFAKD